MAQSTLGALLHRSELALQLVPPPLPEGTLEHPVRWVHSSDLADPTPFLADDLVLLTTGSQFMGADAVPVDVYVTRLSARGVRGLGFGTGVRAPRIPDDLVAACAQAGMPLFEVPYRTPFIAVARAHAESVAAETFARRTWALDAQHALARAALRPRGLRATIPELARRLEQWVGVFDVGGVLTQEHPAESLPPAVRDELTRHARALIARGVHAGQAFSIGAESFTLFTVGRSGHLRGVLAVGTAALDSEARAVVTSVVAMAGLALDQGEQLLRARRRLHTQVLASLMTDDPTPARRVLGALPSAPIVVGIADVGTSLDAVAEWWEHRFGERAVGERVDGERAAGDRAVGERAVGERSSAGFAAASADGLTLCVPAADFAVFDELAEQFGVRVGVSAPTAYDGFSRAVAQAANALRRGHDAVTRFGDSRHAGLLTELIGDDARLVAASRLAPVSEHDGLERMLRAWLENDANIERAATALGIHRHTLRARIAQASKILDTDLSTFTARAELWAMLQATR